MRPRLRIAIAAGEPSGDIIAARLIDALRAQAPREIEFLGVGGPQMAARGVESLFALADIAVFGIFEVIPSIPRVLARARETADAIIEFAPQVLVTIDAQDFSKLVQKRVRRAAPEIRILQYVAPQVWLWRSGRARTITRRVDEVLAIFPFEPKLFHAHGARCAFVGHPATELSVDREAARAAFRASHGIAEDALAIATLPGSRATETTHLAPIFAATMARIAEARPGATAIVVSPPLAWEAAQAAFADAPHPVVMVEADERRLEAFAAADVALTKTGTANIELAIADTPMVAGARVSLATEIVGRPFIKARMANPLNLTLRRKVSPEYLQRALKPDNLAPALMRLVDDATARRDQIEANRTALDLIRAPEGYRSPSEFAAEIVLAHAVRATARS